MAISFYLPRGLMVRTPDFHLRDLGSIPSVGKKSFSFIFLFLLVFMWESFFLDLSWPFLHSNKWSLITNILPLYFMPSSIYKNWLRQGYNRHPLSPPSTALSIVSREHVYHDMKKINICTTQKDINCRIKVPCPVLLV